MLFLWLSRSSMASDKLERLAAQKKRHDKIQADLRTRVNTAKNQLKYEQMCFATYWLCSMLTLWIKIPKEKANMPAVDKYVWRIINGKQKVKKESSATSAEPPPSYL